MALLTESDAEVEFDRTYQDGRVRTAHLWRCPKITLLTKFGIISGVWRINLKDLSIFTECSILKTDSKIVISMAFCARFSRRIEVMITFNWTVGKLAGSHNRRLIRYIILSRHCLNIEFRLSGFPNLFCGMFTEPVTFRMTERWMCSSEVRYAPRCIQGIQENMAQVDHNSMHFSSSRWTTKTGTISLSGANAWVVNRRDRRGNKIPIRLG